MNTWEESALSQISDTFRQLAPMIDPNLHLTYNPKSAKFRRTAAVPGADDAPEHPGRQQQAHMMKMLQVMGSLVLRQERSLSLLQSTDSFILFFQQEKGGILQGLVTETQKWHQLRQQPQGPQMPLRQHLCMWMITEMLNRVTKVAESKPESELVKTCLERNLILADMSWPFLSWDVSQKKLVVDKRQPISMGKMLEHLKELIEDLRDPHLVVKFQSMGPENQQGTIPWRLQLNLRQDRPYDLLVAMVGSAMWALMGTSLQMHKPKLSGLATTLQSMLPSKGKGKGKGAGKGKTMGKMPPQQ